MFDLHNHLLKGEGDGAADLETSLAMASAYVEGAESVACTPHILPGLAERMLEDGIVRILATDAHNMGPRPPGRPRPCTWWSRVRKAFC